MATQNPPLGGGAAPDRVELEDAALLGRTYWPLVWARFRADRAAVAGAALFVAIVLVCFIGLPIGERLLGHGPDDPFPHAVDIATLKPVGVWTRVPDVHTGADPPPGTPTTLLILGADGTTGRDELLRLLAGGQVSLEIGLGAALLAVLIGTILGAFAGYRGGWTDSVISRMTELVMAFPVLLLIIAIGHTVADRFDDITLGGLFKPGVLSLIVVIGVFSWFYPARIIRSIVLGLREQEFVHAARMVGASDWRLIRKHLLPHLVAPMIVWTTLITASVIILEAAISFLNLGVKLPTASWGNMLSKNWGTLLGYDPFREIPEIEKGKGPVVFPAVAIFLTVISLTLAGEGLRRALDPHGARKQ